MIAYHTTLKQRLPSILRDGLQGRFARGKLRAVWVATSRRDGWCLKHMVVNHGADLEDVVRLKVDVPRSWCRRWGKGVWYCLRDVPVSRILSVATFGVTSERRVP